MKLKYLVFSLAGLLLTCSVGAQSVDKETYKFEQFFSIVENYYVDSINKQQLIEAAIEGVLKDLDPHSTYISEEEVREMNEPLQGNFEGIGIQFNIFNDTIMVVSTIAGGPSEKVGLRAGDRIISIEGTNVAGIGIKNSGVRERLLGDKGTVVQVSVKRRGVGNPLVFEIERDKIPIHSLLSSYMLSPKTGYMKLSRFSATTVREFDEALTELRDQGLEYLILDLRDNGGGYLSAAKSMADQFLDDSKMIVYTEGLRNPRRNYRASSYGKFEEGRVVILTDEGTASASEILSGALQDWDRGVIIGRRTFGKGLVQQPYTLRDGSMIRLTVAEYFTPTGRLIQKPYNNGTEDYRKEIERRYKHGEFVHSDSIDFPDSLHFKTKVNNRTVYGGGGIMPDVFVPADTTKYSELHKEIVGKGIMHNVALDYVDKHRKKMKRQYPDFESFEKGFDVSSGLYDSLFDKADEEKIEYGQEEADKSGQMLKLQLKAYIARNLFGLNEYYRIIHQEDITLRKAKDIIESRISYKQILEGNDQ